VPEFVEQVGKIDGVTSVQVYARKAAIIKTKTDIEGIIHEGQLAAILTGNNWINISSKATRLSLTQTDVSRGSLISKSTADRLGFVVGDSILLHIIDQKRKWRLRTNVSQITCQWHL
jgi:hypothetical protein